MKKTDLYLSKSPYFFQIIILFILISTFSRSQTDNRLHLKRADLLENINVDGMSVQILTGSVVFEKNNTILTCEKAQFNQRTEQGILVNNVVVTKGDQVLTCDSLHFDSPNDIITAFGNIHVWDSTYNLVTDTLFYFNSIDSGLALGSVELTQDRQIINALRIEYIKEKDTEGVSYAARENVTIREDDRLVTCGEAVYDRGQGKTILRINPEITENGQTLAGDEIYLQYAGEILQSLSIPAQARGKYPIEGWLKAIQSVSDTARGRSVSFTNEMSGSSLRGFFQDGALDSLRLEGMAATLYHIFEDSIYQGSNQSSGDTITINLESGNIQRIFISGGSQGVYIPDSTAAEMEGPIKYAARDIDYNVNLEETELHGQAHIEYTNMDLKAGFINVQWKSDLLKALPRSPRDSTYAVILPTIVEQGQDPMIGEALIYNLKSRHGRVIKGKTKADDGYYSGHDIRNREQDVFYIEEGIFTTCSLDDPHFHFASERMKMITEDKVIARPIVLYVADIPLIGLPFGVFPHKSGGRHSGWLMPAYGESGLRGQYIDGLGYFWAVSDYWDSKLTFSFADRHGLTLRLNNYYRKRYKFSGRLFLESRQNFLSGTKRSERDISNLFSDSLGNRKSDYVIRWNHSQTLRNSQNLNVNASYYSSGDYNRRTGIDQRNRLNQQAVSNATYSKRWTKSNNSVSVNLSSTRDLMAEKKIDPGEIFYQRPGAAGKQLVITNSTLPRIAFSHSQRSLFPTKKVKKKWFNNIKYSYGSKFDNRLKTFYESEAFGDTIIDYRWKTNTAGDPEVETFSDYIMSHNSSLNAPQKIFRYITLNPSISVRSDWVNKSFTGTLDSSGQVVKTEIKGFAARTTGSFSLSMNTQLFGMFPFKYRSLDGIRHVVSPSVSYNYTPDFSKPLLGRDLGYFERLEPDSGAAVFVDKFAGTLAGGTSRTERQSMRFSLNNVFQAKLIKDGKERKIDLFSWRISTGHNFAAEQFKWSQLRSSIRANVIKKLNLDLTFTHDFYEFDKTSGKRLDIFRKNSRGFPAPRLLDVRFSTGFLFTGKRLSASGEEESAVDTAAVDERLDDANLGPDLGSFAASGRDSKAAPWKTSISVSYAFNNSNPLNPKKTFWMSTNSTFQVTANWRIQYNARFNLINNNLVSHSFSIYRDLHCWELSANWTPNGYASGLYFKLNVKSPTLRDLKIEQRGGIYQRPIF